MVALVLKLFLARVRVPVPLLPILPKRATRIWKRVGKKGEEPMSAYLLYKFHFMRSARVQVLVSAEATRDTGSEMRDRRTADGDSIEASKWKRAVAAENFRSIPTDS